MVTTKTAPSSSSKAGDAVPSEEAFTRMFDEAMKRSSSSSSSKGTPSKLAMSNDEQTKFASAMQKPEFRSLLHDYMTEISDPTHRAETETYLTQLETEHKVPADKLLVRPTPGFVVKATWHEPTTNATTTKQCKLFVNVCSSTTMQPPSSTPVLESDTKHHDTKNPSTKAGTAWHLPYSLGPERCERDHQLAPVATFDVCFHPTTLAHATRQRAFRDMVVATCLDAIERQLQTTRQSTAVAVHKASSRVLKGVAYKSGEPVTMCLRKDQQPPTRATDAVVNATEARTGSKTTDSSKPLDVVVPHDRNASDLELERTKPQATRAEDAARQVRQEQPVVADALIAYTLTHRGTFELLDHLERSPVASKLKRPKALVVTLAFPTLTSAAAIQLDVSAQTVCVTAPLYQALRVALPFPVVEAKGTATFDKKTRALIVTLPVQPPPAPRVTRMSIAVEEHDGNDDDEEDDDVDTKVLTAPHVDPKVSTTSSAIHTTVQRRPDDAFAMLRETAAMVQQDPLYMSQRRKLQTAAAAADASASKTTEDASDLTDLPPLESGSDDGDDDDNDLVIVDAASAAPSPPKASIGATSVDTLVSQSTSGASDNDGKVYERPQITTTETPTCLSFIVHVAHVDPTSTRVAFASSRSFALYYKLLTTATSSDTNKTSIKAEEQHVTWDNLPLDVDTTDAQVDVASENLVVILTKKPKQTMQPKVSRELAPIASIAPVVRFQNEFLYDLD